MRVWTVFSVPSYSHGGGGGGVISSVREPALFGAAPALEVRGPGADSGSDQIGSAPAPGKKGGSGSIH